MRNRSAPPAMQAIRLQMVGGVNYNDPSEVLVAKAFNGPQQIGPVEWQSGHNLDFSRQLGRMRYGSTAKQSLASIMQSGESLICAAFFAESIASNTQFEELAIGTKSIYINRWNGMTQGTWAQVTNNAGAAYLHTAAVVKASIVSHDGHAFLMLDGANSIQVYRTGTQLDDQLSGNYTGSSPSTTTINGDSNSGQKVVNVASTTIFNVGDRVTIGIGSGDAGTDTGYVASIQAGTSITLVANLTHTHTSAHAATVTVANLYTQSFGGATQTITGSWGQGYYLGMAFQGVFGYSKGDVTFEFSGPTNPWDRFNGGARACDGPIVAMEAFTPKFANLLGSVGVFHTLAENAALQFLSGFDPSATMSTIVGASPAMNYQSVCQTMNWVMYLTRNRRIEATDLNKVIDVGRRLRGQDSDSTGPLNTMNLTAAITNAFAFYDGQKRQAQFYFPDNTASVNTDAMVVDMQLGEPTGFDNAFTDTGSYSFERTLRMLYWNLNSEASGSTWFAQMYQLPGSIRGILATGQLYQTETPNSGLDLDTYPIQFDIRSPDFNAGLVGIQKKWRRLSVRSISTSVGVVQVDSFLDRATIASAPLSWTFDQLGPGVDPLGVTTFILGKSKLGGGGLVAGHFWLDCVSETLAFSISLTTNRPTGFILSTIDLMYQQANLQD